MYHHTTGTIHAKEGAPIRDSAAENSRILQSSASAGKLSMRCCCYLREHVVAVDNVFMKFCREPSIDAGVNIQLRNIPRDTLEDGFR